jgi:hypothetical protein
VLSWAGILAALLLVTAVVNAPSLKAFVTFPRWASGGAPRLSLGGRLAGGLALYRDFFAYLELPGTAIPWCLLVVAAALRPSMGQRPAALRLGFVLFLALPVHFLLLRGATGYEFWTRYYMPFFGLGLGLVGVGMGVRPGLRASQRGDLIATTLAVILILTCIIRLERRPGSASLPPQNFSEHFRYFEALKSGGPTLVIADAGSGLTPAVYFHVVGKPIPPSLQWLSCSETDTFGCLDAIIGATDYPGCIAEATLGAFLRKYPQGKVVLYQGAGPCPPLVTQEGLRAGATGLGQASCAWSLTGITRPGEVRAFAARNGFAYP